MGLVFHLCEGLKVSFNQLRLEHIFLCENFQSLSLLCNQYLVSFDLDQLIEDGVVF